MCLGWFVLYIRFYYSMLENIFFSTDDHFFKIVELWYFQLLERSISLLDTPDIKCWACFDFFGDNQILDLNRYTFINHVLNIDHIFFIILSIFTAINFWNKRNKFLKLCPVENKELIMGTNSENIFNKIVFIFNIWSPKNHHFIAKQRTASWFIHYFFD
jgi:hypothetical protein